MICLVGAACQAQFSTSATTSHIPLEITTPDTVDTPIGTLEFFDGVPTDATVQTVYDNLDRMRGVEVFLNLIPGVSMFGLREGPRSLGQKESHQVVIFDKLMSSESLFLTANTSTMYAFPFLDLKKDGPTVVEVPPGLLGAFNDMWFRYAGDVGPAGPDKGKGGSYLVLPPGYQGDVPDGYYDVYFGPKAPMGKEENWLETIPGKSWFIILRMYGPLEPWIEKTWRPGEIELVE